MNPSKISVRRASFLLASMLVGSSLFGAADDSTTTAVPPNPTTSAAAAAQSQDDEIARLKAALAEQQKQLQALQQMLQNQQQLIEKVTGTTAPSAPVTASDHPILNRSLGDVASLTPVLPAPAPAPSAIPVSIAAPKPNPQAGSTQNAGGGNPCEAPPDANQVPPYLRIGSVCVVPVGFMDLTPFWRDKNAGSSMGSNFGSVPLNNAANGNLSETKFTLQNSRLGFRVDGDWKGTHFIGYNEFDFNGTGGATNMAVTNGAIVPRLRLYWVDVRKGAVEFLGGQSWSMLTPNRRGLSALPGDLFYGQEIDINYLAGLTWSRQGGARVLLHGWGDKLTWGFSVEQPDQYMGGSAGGSAAVLPSALTGLAETQLDNGNSLSGSPAGNYLTYPTLTPDFITKLAIDPSSRFHFEVGGVLSTFKIALNQNATTGAVAIAAPYNIHPTTEGGALLFGINAGITNNFRVISTNFWGDGEGRYMFGQAPDVIVTAAGNLSGVRSGATLDGLEATIKNTLLYAYSGTIYIARNAAIDANGKSLVGYGYSGSNQNRTIQEITFGFNQTMWRNPRYGAINLMGQYEWLNRELWWNSPTAPKGTHDSTIYLDVRYTLPGSMPNF